MPSTNANPSSTTDYLSFEDLDQLFFHHPKNDLNPLLHSLYHQHPQHFYYDRKKTCYIAKHHVLDLARSLHLFALAELCTLSHEELLHRVADPLFAITNAVMLRPVTPKRMDIDLDWFPLPRNDNSFFFSLLNPDSHPIDHAATLDSNTDPVHSTSISSFFPTFHSWTRHFLPLQNVGSSTTLRAQKQQQAIIDCRMRLIVYRQSLPAAIQQKQNANQDQKRKSPDDDYDHQKLKRLKSLYSNLDLLATQATKMKGLPLSPEISPPPSSVLSLPPISTTNSSSFYSSSFIQSISLPSIRNVLSDI